MGQESAEIWTAQTLLQPGRFLPPTLLGDNSIVTAPGGVVSTVETSVTVLVQVP